MKIIGIALLAISASAIAADIYVHPYSTRDGTYVEGHHRTTPNSTRLDNYSTQGNTNPWTGQQGTVNPYPTPQPTYTPPSIHGSPASRRSGF
jgi:hypothetical protein